MRYASEALDPKELGRLAARRGLSLTEFLRAAGVGEGVQSTICRGEEVGPATIKKVKAKLDELPELDLPFAPREAAS